MAQGDILGVVMQSDIGSGASGGIAAQAQISGVFSATATYAVGDYVVYNSLLYRCTTPHSGAWNAAHFEQVTIGGELNTRTPVYGRGVDLLVNSYFIGGGSQQGGGRFPINQREQTNYSGIATYFDRWKSVDPANVTSIEPDGIAVASSVFQEIENIDSLLGKTLTFSALSADGLTTVTVNMPSTYPSVAATPHTDNGSSRVTLRYIAGSVRAYLGRKPGVTSSVKYYAAKLELGDTQTLAHQDAGGNWVLNDPSPNFQQELAKCQRYQYVPSASASGYRLIGIGVATSDSNIRVFMHLPVPLRNTPSNTGIVLGAVSDVVATSLTGKGNFECSAVYRDSASIGSAASLVFQVTGATVGDTFNCYTRNNCIICLDANM